LRNRIEKIVDYYDASKRENLEKFTEPLLTAFLLDNGNEAREIEESINDIIHIKLAAQDLLHLKLGFHVPTKVEAAGDYSLGRVLKGNKPLHEFGMKNMELSTNLFVSGITGSGKTTTVLKLLYQWFLEGKSAIVFDWKADYISLLRPLQSANVPLADRFWVFSVSNDGFKFNPLRPPESVDVMTWIETFTDMFIHTFGLREPSASILVKCLKELYKENTHPTLAELASKVEGYQPISSFDKESWRSILTRLTLLTEASLGSVFSTRIGVKLEDLMKKFVIFDLSRIPLLENKRFFIEVIYGMVYEYLKAKDDREKTKGLFVIEEAHNVFGPKTNFDRDIMLKPEIALCEMRDFGWGTIVIDQQPSKLSSEVVANTANKICHKVVRKEDREVIRNAMSLTKEQSEYLGELSKGEVLVKLDRDSFPYTFHASIEPVTFTGQVTRNEVQEYMKPFFETYPIDKESELEISESKVMEGIKTSPTNSGIESFDLNPEKVLENPRWLNSVKNKIENVPVESRNVLLLLGEGSSCKSSDFKSLMKIPGDTFRRIAFELAKSGLIGFKKPRAPGNPVLYFLRPEGLAAFHLVTGKWPFEVRASNPEKKHRHSEMKEKAIEIFRKVGWGLTDSKVEHGYVDICLSKDDLTIPIEICTGSNKFEQVYNNVLKCVETFGGVYFVCENVEAYNVVLQQASKFSFDHNDLKFLLYIILYENFLRGESFEKYEF